RWLIPALERFKRAHPKVRIRVETTHYVDFPLDGHTDIAITYRRSSEHEASQDREGELLLRDFSRPVLSPTLLAQSAYENRGHVANVPALKCSENNWDWKLWTERVGLDASALVFADEFDTDDSALRAAAAGLGMVLATPLHIEAEMKSGALVELPDAPAVEVGGFYLLTSPNQSKAVRQFRSWLHQEFDQAG
ncbi:MAG: LysR substrate-binding domain-containing protein, partial [Pseudomonadota bacterium]